MSYIESWRPNKAYNKPLTIFVRLLSTPVNGSVNDRSNVINQRKHQRSGLSKWSISTSQNSESKVESHPTSSSLRTWNLQAAQNNSIFPIFLDHISSRLPTKHTNMILPQVTVRCNRKESGHPWADQTRRGTNWRSYTTGSRSSRGALHLYQGM